MLCAQGAAELLFEVGRFSVFFSSPGSGISGYIIESIASVLCSSPKTVNVSGV